MDLLHLASLPSLQFLGPPIVASLSFLDPPSAYEGLASTASWKDVRLPFLGEGLAWRDEDLTFAFSWL